MKKKIWAPYMYTFVNLFSIVYHVKSNLLLPYCKSGPTYSSNVPLRIMVPEGVNWPSSSVE